MNKETLKEEQREKTHSISPLEQNYKKETAQTLLYSIILFLLRSTKNKKTLIYIFIMAKFMRAVSVIDFSLRMGTFRHACGSWLLLV